MAVITWKTWAKLRPSINLRRNKYNICTSSRQG